MAGEGCVRQLTSLRTIRRNRQLVSVDSDGLCEVSSDLGEQCHGFSEQTGRSSNAATRELADADSMEQRNHFAGGPVS